MKIKKVSQTAAVVGQILNEKSNSEKDTYSCDYINENVDINPYSTSEIKTNKIWINNKPIYRKVIDNITMSNVVQTVNTGISNLEDVIKMDAYVKYSNTSYSPISAGYVFNYSAGSITISPLSNFLNLSSYVGYIIIEYTKTTD